MQVASKRILIYGIPISASISDFWFYENLFQTTAEIESPILPPPGLSLPVTFKLTLAQEVVCKIRCS